METVRNNKGSHSIVKADQCTTGGLSYKMTVHIFPLTKSMVQDIFLSMIVSHNLSNDKKGHGWGSHLGPALGEPTGEAQQNLWREHMHYFKKKKKSKHPYLSDLSPVRITEELQDLSGFQSL